MRPVISDTVLIKEGEGCLIMHVETDRIKRRAETRLVTDNQATGSINLTYAYTFKYSQLKLIAFY